MAEKQYQAHIDLRDKKGAARLGLRADVPNLNGRYSIEFWFWNAFPDDVRPVAGYLLSRGPDGDKDCRLAVCPKFLSFGCEIRDVNLHFCQKLFAARHYFFAFDVAPDSLPSIGTKFFNFC